MKNTGHKRAPHGSRSRQRQLKQRPRARPSGVASRRQLERALIAFRGSVRSTVTRAEALLSASAAIGDAAQDAFRKRLLESLTAGGVLGSLDRLSGQIEPTSEHLRGFREVLVGWLRDQLELEPTYQPGETIEIPRDALRHMTLGSGVPPSDASLVKVQVLQCGWAVRGRELVKPEVELISRTTQPTR